MSHKIVIPIDKVEAISTHINRWKEAGWDDASDYHFFTWDASFLDYSKEGQGHDIDRKKMVCYQSLQPNTERFKKYEAHLFEIELPSLDHSDSRTENLSIIERVKYLLACIFGRTLLSCEEQALQVGVVILLKGTS